MLTIDVQRILDKYKRREENVVVKILKECKRKIPQTNIGLTSKTAGATPGSLVFFT